MYYILNVLYINKHKKLGQAQSQEARVEQQSHNGVRVCTYAYVHNRQQEAKFYDHSPGYFKAPARALLFLSWSWRLTNY